MVEHLGRAIQFTLTCLALGFVAGCLTSLLGM